MSGFQIKYRPETLGEVIGNTAAVNSVQALLSREIKDVPQAILVHGPAGCGKTTLGRIIADELGCVTGCFFEYNSSNTRGIDTIREIQEQSKLSALFGEIKVYLLDEFHMATNPAQNAALKMLEDCPKKTFFILATTNPEKLIKPIRSRCTSISVAPLNRKQSKELIQSVLDKENDPDFPKDVTDAIADASDGVPRDMLKLLDQVFNMEDIDEMIDTVNHDIPDESGVKDLCRLLMEKPNNKKWKDVADCIKGLSGNPETIRISMLGYFSKVLLSTGDNRIAELGECFEDNWYDKGSWGLHSCCFAAYTI